jgi:hypothetical protein
MFQRNILAGIVILTMFFTPSAYAGKVELTTYYPPAYAEYTNLKSTGNSYFASTSGSVGIGTASPNASSKLDVAGEIHSSATASGFFLGGGGTSDTFARLTTNAAFIYHDLAVGVFWANGATRFDLAEVTPVKEEDKLSQGEVVVIDKKGSRVTRSTSPYDTSVFGIVSSYAQASMVIGGGVAENPAETKDKLPVALVGRVKAKVSAENGPIEPGDMLTTSSTPGHLMKCDDRMKCLGAVAGKALEPWEKDTGTIEVFAALR